MGFEKCAENNKSVVYDFFSPSLLPDKTGFELK